jgi:hypothetical protein
MVVPPIDIRRVYSGYVGSDDDVVIRIRGECSLAASVPTPATALYLTGYLIDNLDSDLSFRDVVYEVGDRVLAYSR